MDINISIVKRSNEWYRESDLTVDIGIQGIIVSWGGKGTRVLNDVKLNMDNDHEKPDILTLILNVEEGSIHSFSQPA